MGLDMYLTGREYQTENRGTLDGFEISAIEIDMQAWRKNAPLHCFIVQEIYGGEDDCNPIDLNADELREIARAIRAGDLPPDDECAGFFFGSPEMWALHRKNAEQDAQAFEKAAAWKEANKPWRSVTYCASW